jgi:GNAT superfamily N-acetyltransferase
MDGVAQETSKKSILPEEQLTTSARLRSGEPVTLRPLRAEDAVRLGEYFRWLSEETRARYGPHPFDQATADAICAALDPTDMLRMVAVTQESARERIIAYVLLKRGAWEADRERYAKLGIPLDPATVSALAPSVADDYQNQGVGALLVKHVLDISRALGEKRVVLWGGVQATNERGIYFYNKLGFRKVGEFFNDKNNHDMILDLY